MRRLCVSRPYYLRNVRQHTYIRMAWISVISSSICGNEEKAKQRTSHLCCDKKLINVINGFVACWELFVICLVLQKQFSIKVGIMISSNSMASRHTYEYYSLIFPLSCCSYLPQRISQPVSHAGHELFLLPEHLISHPVCWVSDVQLAIAHVHRLWVMESEFIWLSVFHVCLF